MAEATKINTRPLMGLRGFASLHIMIGHYIKLTTRGTDLNGGSLVILCFSLKSFEVLIYHYACNKGQTVTLFPVLSGFIMSVVYGTRQLHDLKSRIEFAKSFYFKRLLRLTPVYYASLLFAIGIGLRPYYGQVCLF